MFRRITKTIFLILVVIAAWGIYSEYTSPIPLQEKTLPPMNVRTNIPTNQAERTRSLAEIRSINDRVIQQNFQESTTTNSLIKQNTISNDPLDKLRAEGAYVLAFNVKTSEAFTAYSKNGRLRLPIASITKMMALVTSDLSAPATTSVTITEKTKSIYEKDTLFSVGDTWTKEDLLPTIVIASNNIAIEALAELHNVQDFVITMNSIAQEIGMTGTRFVNATGLDQIGDINVSTPRDIAVLGAYLAKNRPDILELSRLQSYSFTRSDGETVTLQNTNGSLTDRSLPWKVIGGKTGTTARAQQALLLITESENPNVYIIGVILRSPNRTDDMALLLNEVSQFKNLKDFINK